MCGCSLRGPNAAMTGASRCNAGRSTPSVRFRLRRRGRRGRGEDRPGRTLGEGLFQGFGSNGSVGSVGSGSRGTDGCLAGLCGRSESLEPLVQNPRARDAINVALVCGRRSVGFARRRRICFERASGERGLGRETSGEGVETKDGERTHQTLVEGRVPGLEARVSELPPRDTGKGAGAGPRRPRRGASTHPCDRREREEASNRA